MPEKESEKLRYRMSEREAKEEVRRLTGVHYLEFAGKSKKRPLVTARSLYVYLRIEKGGASQTAIMKELSVSDTHIYTMTRMGRMLCQANSQWFD